MRLLLPGIMAFLVWSAATLALYQRWFLADQNNARTPAGERTAIVSSPKLLKKAQTPFAQNQDETATPSPNPSVSKSPEATPAESQPLILQPLAIDLMRDAQSGAWQIEAGKQGELAQWTQRLNEQPGAGICVVCPYPATEEKPDMERGNAIRQALFQLGIQPARVALVFEPERAATSQKAATAHLLFVPEDPLPWSAAQHAVLASYQQVSTGPEGLSGEGGMLLTRHLRFAYGSSALPEDPETKTFFTNLSHYLNRHPEKSVCITGHTCDISSASFNQRLGAARAASVRQRLLDLGIAPERLRAESAGEGQPIGENGSSAGQQANRRVELFIR